MPTVPTKRIRHTDVKGYKSVQDHDGRLRPFSLQKAMCKKANEIRMALGMKPISRWNLIEGPDFKGMGRGRNGTTVVE